MRCTRCLWVVRSQPMERPWDVYAALVGCSLAARRLSVASLYFVRGVVSVFTPWGVRGVSRRRP